MITLYRIKPLDGTSNRTEIILVMGLSIAEAFWLVPKNTDNIMTSKYRQEIEMR